MIWEGKPSCCVVLLGIAGKIPGSERQRASRFRTAHVSCPDWHFDRKQGLTHTHRINVYAIYGNMDPSIYPSHVSIFLSAPWILWVYEIIFSMVLESLRIVPNIWAIGKQVIFQHGLHRSHGFELMDHMIPWSHHEEKPRLVCLFLLDIFFFRYVYC